MTLPDPSEKLTQTFTLGCDPTISDEVTQTGGIANFEATGHAADSITVQPRVDGDEWVTLDTFVVNDDTSAMVGDQTGQTFGETGATLTYYGGVLDTPDDDGTCTDFDDLEAGDTVSDQYTDVSISTQRAGEDTNSENDAMIFDTAKPTGGEHDLASDTADTVIITSEDNDSKDADDNAQGGTISFSFESPSQVQSLNFLDIKEAGGTVDLFDAIGDLISTIAIPVTGDGEEQAVDIYVDGVAVMDVHLVGSGAVDDLCYFSPACDDCTSQYGVTYLDDIPTVDVPEDDLYSEDDPVDILPA